MIRTGQFRYVKHDKIEEMHRAGWMVVDDFDGCTHGFFAVLMWRCGCEGWDR